MDLTANKTTLIFLISIISIMIITSSCNSNKDYIRDDNIENKVEKPKTRTDTFYYSNGQIESVFEYKNGILVGDQLNFHPNGQKSSIINYKNGVMQSVFNWFETGELSMERYNNMDGVADSLSFFYYKNGNIKAKGYYLKGIVFEEWTNYDKDGNVTDEFSKAIE